MLEIRVMEVTKNSVRFKYDCTDILIDFSIGSPID